MKTCAKCGKTKSLDNFAKNCAKKDGLQTYCKSCHNKCKNTYESTTRAKLLRKSRRKLYRSRPDERIKNNIACSNRRMNGINGSLTKDSWIDIQLLFNNRCAYCQSDGLMTIDHIHPVKLRGRLDPNNILPSCQSCNSSKNSKLLWIEWIPSDFNWDGYLKWNRYCYGDWWGQIKETEMVKQYA